MLCILIINTLDYSQNIVVFYAIFRAVSFPVEHCFYLCLFEATPITHITFSVGNHYTRVATCVIHVIIFRSEVVSLIGAQTHEHHKIHLQFISGVKSSVFSCITFAGLQLAGWLKLPSLESPVIADGPM